MVKATTTGTVSNSDGTYKLDTRQNTGSLVFSFVGFKTIEVSFDFNFRITILRN